MGDAPHPQLPQAEPSVLGKLSEWAQLLTIPMRDGSPTAQQEEERAKAEGGSNPTDPEGWTSSCSLRNCHGSLWKSR